MGVLLTADLAGISAWAARGKNREAGREAAFPGERVQTVAELT